MDFEVTPVETDSPKWGLFGTLAWGFVIFISFIFIQFFVLGIYIGLEHGAVAESEIEELMTALQYNGVVVSFGAFATLLICGAMILGVIALKKGSSIKEYLGLKMVSAKTFGTWSLILFAYIALHEVFYMMLDRTVPEFMTSIYLTAEPIWLIWIATIICAPVLEEIFYRGFLFTGIKASFLGPVGAVILTSLLWTVIHMQYDLFFLSSIFILGVVLGVARLKTGSVVLVIWLHALNNLVASIGTALHLS